MIVYKWVIKKDKKYFPIINNGAFAPFDKLKLGYYKKGYTSKEFFNPYTYLPKRTYKPRGFHRTGYHFWTKPKGQRFLYYQCSMKRLNKQINCILKCYVRNKDLILKDENRVIAKKFRVLNEY